MVARGGSWFALKAVRWISIAAVIALFGFSVPWFIWNPINGDTGFFVHSGMQILDGAKLYRDIVEPNTPPAFLLPAAMVAIGRLAGWTPEASFVLLLSLVIALSVYRIYRIVGQLSSISRGADAHVRARPPGRAVSPIVNFAAPLLTLTAAYALMPFVQEKFGEREHIMVALILPWLLASVSDTEFRSRREQLLDAAVAALGLSMKPYFLAIYAVIQLLNLAFPRRRAQLFRPDNLLIAATQVAVAGAAWFLFPDYRFVFRLALATYHNFHKPLFDVSLHPSFLFFVLVALVSLGFRAGYPLSKLRNVLLAAGGAMVAVVFYQREGLPYHYYPLGVLGLLIAATILLDWMEAWSAPSRERAAMAFAVVLTAVGIYQGTRPLEMGRWTGPLVPVVRAEALGKPILVLSTSLWSGSPLINYTGTTSAWRFRSLWPLGEFYDGKPAPGDPHPYRTRAEMSEYERFLIDSLVEDTRLHAPRLIIVETSLPKEGFRNGDFDYLDYFSRDERFAAFFRDYEKLADITMYRVYRRR